MYRFRTEPNTAPLTLRTAFPGCGAEMRTKFEHPGVRLGFQGLYANPTGGGS
jgi:hypothetical protein